MTVIPFLLLILNQGTQVQHGVATPAPDFGSTLDRLIKDEHRRDKDKGEKEKGKVEDDSPLERMRWMRKTLVNDQGIIPKDGYKKAILQRQANLLSQGLRPPTSGGTNTWTFRGPSNIGGRTRSLV